MLEGFDLKLMRITKHVTATEAARQCGMSRSLLSMVEAGERKLTRAMYDKLLEFYDHKEAILR